jgi:acyl-homoserine lactone acylase PvdQ
MKKILFWGLFITASIVSVVTLTLTDSKNDPSFATIYLSNTSALSQENQEDWHSGECHTVTTVTRIPSLTVSNGDTITTYSPVDKVSKRCDHSGGASCQYGDKYYSVVYGDYIIGSYSSQSCQG